MSDTLTFGYWGVRGRGQITRLVCAHTGVKWEDKVYQSPEEWFGQDKQELGILFPNLPYIIDGDIKVSESDILPRYVIKKSGQTELLGKNARDMAMVDNVIYTVLDLWAVILPLFFNKKWEDEKTPLFYKNKSKFSKLQKFINSKPTTLDYLTLADFFIAEFSYYVEKLFPQQYSKFKSLQNVRSTIEGLEGVKKYYEREDAVQAVFLPPTSTAFPFMLDKFSPKTPPPSVLSDKLKSTSSPKKQSSTSESPKQVVINNGEKLKILLISGSLRKNSTNTGLLKACVQINNPHIEFDWATISDLPLFNEDIEKDETLSVQRLRNQVKNSHGILFGVTENNYSISAAQKNAYDWLSRGQKQAVIHQIPAGMVSTGYASGGKSGQKALRTIGEFCQVKFMKTPEVFVNLKPGSIFDEQGNLVDDKIREQLKVFLQAFARWVDSNKAVKA